MNIIKKTLKNSQKTNNDGICTNSKFLRLALPYKILKDSLNIDPLKRYKSTADCVKVPSFPKSPYGNHNSGMNYQFDVKPVSFSLSKARKPHRE